MENLLHDTTFWFTVSFVIFVILAVKLGSKPIASVLDEHGRKVKAELDEAAALHAEAAKLLAETESKHAYALKEADEIVARAKEHALELQAQASKDLYAMLKRRQQQGEDRMRQLENQAAGELRAAAAAIALQAAETVLKESADKERDEALIRAQMNAMAAALKKVA
jgi:F-type H+-transporting ATPase subunit b